MNIYHTDVDSRIVERLEKEFGEIKNLIVTPQNYKLVKYNWQEKDDCGHPRDSNEPVFGFERGSLDKLLLINRDGSFHHFIKFVVEAYQRGYRAYHMGDQFAYVHIDQHLDFSHQYTYANFVGRIFWDLGVPVYILDRALNPQELNGCPKPSSEFCLIKPIRKEKDVDGAFNFAGRTKAVYTDSIREHYIYLSTDLDAFPFDLFETRWDRNARKDFDISTYKRIVEQLTEEHKVVGADFTGLLDGNNRSLDNLVDLIKFMQGILDRKDEQ